MSPTIFRWRGYRFFFFFREERGPHVHAESRKMVEEKRNELLDAWHKHFPG